MPDCLRDVTLPAGEVTFAGRLLQFFRPLTARSRLWPLKIVSLQWLLIALNMRWTGRVAGAVLVDVGRFNEERAGAALQRDSGSSLRQLAQTTSE